MSFFSINPIELFYYIAGLKLIILSNKRSNLHEYPHLLERCNSEEHEASE